MLEITFFHFLVYNEMNIHIHTGTSNFSFLAKLLNISAVFNFFVFFVASVPFVKCEFFLKTPYSHFSYKLHATKSSHNFLLNSRMLHVIFFINFFFTLLSTSFPFHFIRSARIKHLLFGPSNCAFLTVFTKS